LRSELNFGCIQTSVGAMRSWPIAMPKLPAR
jgi:hypothetical protein